MGSTAGDLAAALADHPSIACAPEGLALWAAGTPVADDALVGGGLLVNGAALTLDRRSGTPSPADHGPRRTPVAVAVAHGPDAGRTVELAPGVHTVGRSGEATICLHDARLSRLHAALAVTADGITVADLGSTNGTYLEHRRVGSEPQPLVVGATVRLGDTKLVLRPVGGVPAAVTSRGDGTRTVNRRPRLLAAPVPVSIALPAPPEQPPPTRVPWIAMALPVPFAGVMAIFFGPMMLAFALMSPLLMAGTALSDRVGSRRRYAAEHAAHRRHLGAAQERVAAACAEEARALRSSLPDPQQVLAIATMPTARLWERRRADPDRLTVGVGRCSTPATLRVIRPPGDDGPEHPVLEDVPCTVPLADLGVVGCCGQREAVVEVVRAVVGQLVTLHSPLDLELVLVAGGRRADDCWSWLGRLPHAFQRDSREGHDGHHGERGPGGPHWVSGLDDELFPARAAVAQLAHLVQHRRSSATSTAPWTGPHTVVLLDGSAALRALPDLAVVLEHGPSVGITTLALDEDREGLPSETRAVLDLATPERARLHLPGSTATELVVDRVGPWWADRLSRGLAPLRDATPRGGAGSLAAFVGLTELLVPEVADRLPHGPDPRGHEGLGAPGLDAAVVARGWAQVPHRTSVPVGVTPGGTFCIDLAADGPHILVAGTTGSGKSELLRTLVASLAVHNRPEHLSFVLVDYKGGAAFRDCSALPHVSGVVTDLDDHLAERALTSLTAELTRRERLLAEAGVTDFVAYQSSSTSERSPLARLAIVIDEFRALAEELPQFVDGMVRIAALGRSLGVHVVLATQRPAGVVTADIKANVNLRIALRVRDRADSDDVIDAPDAAALDRAVPGRGYARCGGGSLTMFQAAHAGGRSQASEPRGIRVRTHRWDRGPEAVAGDGRPGEGTAPTDLHAVVDAVCRAAADVAAETPPSPWLPALPELVHAPSLSPTDDLRIPIGLADEPAAQRQRALELDLAAPGHWGFVGTIGSGRTTALVGVAAAAMSRLDASRLHVYAVSGGSLSGCAELPHCGAHVEWDDLRRLERLVARLAADVTDRRQRLTTSGHTTMGAWWRAEDETAPPALLLLVDDWDVLAQRTDQATHGALVDRLLGLLREGAGVGVTAVVGGERALLVGRAASAMGHRVLLRLSDRSDALLAGLPPKALPTLQAPGRGVLLDGTEVQLALPARPDAASRPTADGAAPGSPWRVDALPSRVDAASLPTSADPEDRVLLGVGGDELSSLGLSPGSDGRRWLVTGGHGSGVTTTLVLVVHDALRRGRRVAVVATRPGSWGPLRQDPRVLWCDDPTRSDELVALRRAVPGLVVVVDDADALVDSPVESALRQVSSLVDRDGGLVVAGASSSALSVQYRGLAVDLVRHRTGVLLGPASLSEADLLGVPVPVDPGAPPGRGHLVRAGVATPLQVALTSASHPAVPAYGTSPAPPVTVVR
jgi:S-DNA-T family DNA segregation ATPase FtsK/SpoIIIE